jgi:hypothetical protein
MQAPAGQTAHALPPSAGRRLAGLCFWRVGARGARSRRRPARATHGGMARQIGGMARQRAQATGSCLVVRRDPIQVRFGSRQKAVEKCCSPLALGAAGRPLKSPVESSRSPSESSGPRQSRVGFAQSARMWERVQSAHALYLPARPSPWQGVLPPPNSHLASGILE